MSANTKIEWADHTFNPWEGCQKVGPGCDHCYAESRNARFAGGVAVNWGPGAPRRRTSESNWQQPIKWDRDAAAKGIRYRVFCASLADVFDNEVDSQWLADLFALIALTPNLDWLLLTKRIGNALRMIEEGRWFPSHWPNVWLGITVVNQEEADRDIPKLLAVPAAKRFLSMEPLLGSVIVFDLDGPVDVSYGSKSPIDWVIVGGESGPNARPMHPDWARSLRDQCQAAGVPFLFKQWGEWLPGSQAREVDNQIAKVGGCDHGWRWDNGTHSWRVGKKVAGRLLDGRTWDEVPA